MRGRSRNTRIIIIIIIIIYYTIIMWVELFVFMGVSYPRGIAMSCKNKRADSRYKQVQIFEKQFTEKWMKTINSVEESKITHITTVNNVRWLE